MQMFSCGVGRHGSKMWLIEQEERKSAGVAGVGAKKLSPWHWSETDRGNE